MLRRTDCALLMCLLCMTAAAQVPGSSCDAHGFPKDCNESPISADSEIPNFHRVDADLYRGARPEARASAKAYTDLADLGVRTIINLEGKKAARGEQARVNAALANQEARIAVIPFHISSPWHTFLLSTSHQRIHDLFTLIQKAPKPVFIHCKYGKDRTGAVVILYRVKRNELEDFATAYSEAHHYKFSWLNFGLKRTVNRYKQNRDKLNDLPEPALPASPATGVCRSNPAVVPCH